MTAQLRFQLSSSKWHCPRLLHRACNIQHYLLTDCLISVSCLQPKDWSIKMNKKERRLALSTALQSAAGDIVVVDDVTNAAGQY